MRERGLKSDSAGVGVIMVGSLPMRERGLKSAEHDRREGLDGVAPHAGAWIEIRRSRPPCRASPGSLPMRERGLK